MQGCRPAADGAPAGQRGGRGRVAVTSRDGVSVNERLHRAVDFVVFERRGNDVAFVERRVRPESKAKVDRDFSTLAKLLEDCEWVVSLGFNGEARKELAARGFRLLETRGTIDEVIRKLPLDTRRVESGQSSD